MANNSHKDKEGRYPIKPTTIETVDQAVVDYFDKKLNIHVDSAGGRFKVPVIFAAGERWKLVRDKKGLRDDKGALLLPIMAVRRFEFDRTRGFGGLYQETPEITISSLIHPKTGLIQNLTEQRKVAGFPEARKPPVREYLTIPFPDFAQVLYEIIIWAQYQEQMNEILEKIWYNYDHMDSFVMPVDHDGTSPKANPKGNSYYFVGFREGSIVSQSNVEEFTGEERVLKYSYVIRTPVYLMLDPKDETLSYGDDEEGRKVVTKYQNAVDIKTKEQILTLEEYEKLFG